MRCESYDRFEPLVIGPQERVFVLTGAGVSAESGLSTFRDANGLWNTHRVEEIASPAGWARDPQLVWQFYSQRRAKLAAVEPNAAHVALGKAEERLGERFFLCTQNVDDLHERGGAMRVTHMHGELRRSRCERCDRPSFVDQRLYETLEAIARCECGGRLRPHICWFGETPFDLDAICAALDECDVFVTIGSSGVVYPAAQFVRRAKSRTGVRAIYVGPEEPDNAYSFDECRLGTAVQVVPTLFAAH
jgi:NAD-dependent deacetylase